MSNKFNLTIISVNESLSQFNAGTKVQLEKDKNNAFDPFAIKAYIDGKEVGFVASSTTTVVPGSISNREFYPHFKNDTIYGVVISQSKVSFRNGVTKTALIIEVGARDKNNKVSNKANLGGSLMYSAKIRGGIKAYPGKTSVMKEFEENPNHTSVTLKKEEDNIIAYFNGVPSGIVDERKAQDTTDFNALEEVVSALGKVTARVVSLSATIYTVEFDVDKQTLEEAKAGKKVTSLDDLKNEIVAQGICTSEEIQDVEDYLIKNGLSRRDIVAVLKTYKKYDEERTARIPQKPETLFNDYFGAVKKNVVYINKGKNLRFVGEKGTGKNNLITTIAWIYKRPLYEVSLNSQFDKTDLLGTKTIVNTGDVTEIDEVAITEKGGFISGFKSLVSTIRNIANVFLKRTTAIAFDKEAFVEAMEVGGIINLDEVNTADPSVLVLLHSVADRRRSLQVPGYGRVVADDNFSIILTMNKDYAGTVSLNEATRDRFTPIKFPSNTSIKDLLQAKYPMADSDYIRYCDQLYQGILGLVQDGELTMDCMTVRGFEDAIEVADELGLREALIDNVANRVDDEDYCQHILNMIDDILD